MLACLLVSLFVRVRLLLHLLHLLQAMALVVAIVAHMLHCRAAIGFSRGTLRGMRVTFFLCNTLHLACVRAHVVCLFASLFVCLFARVITCLFVCLVVCPFV